MPSLKVGTLHLLLLLWLTMQLFSVRYLGIALFTAFFLNIGFPALPLHAATLDFSFYGVDSDQKVLSATGTFTAVDNGGGQFTITAITGTITDELVSLGAENLTVLLDSGTFSNNNLLFPNASDANKLDGSGFSFQTASGLQYNVSSNGNAYSLFDTTSVRASSLTLTSFTVTNVRQGDVAVPEPLPLPIPVLGLVIGTGSLLLSVHRKLVG
jgi:hypothetical protein